MPPKRESKKELLKDLAHWMGEVSRIVYTIAECQTDEDIESDS